MRALLAAACLAAIVLQAPVPGTIRPAAAQEQAASVGPAAIEAIFLQALSAINQGRPDEAIPLLRRILAIHPNLARVRLELARALYLAGEREESRRQFQTVLSGPGLPAPVRQNVLRFIRSIDADRGVAQSLSFALVAPSGSGRRYDTDVVIIDLFGTPLPFVLDRPKPPAFGLQIDAALLRQWPVALAPGGAEAAFALRAQGRVLDAPGDDFDEHRLEVSPGLRLAWPRSTAFVETPVTLLRQSGGLRETRAGVAVGMERRGAGGWSAFATASASYADSARGRSRDGMLYTGSIGLRQALGGQGDVGLVLSGERRAAERADFGYTEVSLRASRRLDLSGGLSLDASAFALVHVQDRRTPGFPARREEVEFGADLAVEKTDLFLLGRYTPFLRIGASRRNSNIDAYSYGEYLVQAGIRSAF